MIQSQVAALRCAAALPSWLLSRKYVQDTNGTIIKSAEYRMRQLEACKTTAARRLILGTSR
jgi:hypothetical protein